MSHKHLTNILVNFPGTSARRHDAHSAPGGGGPAAGAVPRGPVPHPRPTLSAAPHAGLCQSQSEHPRLQLPHGAGQRELWQGKYDEMSSSLNTISTFDPTAVGDVKERRHAERDRIIPGFEEVLLWC